MAGQIDSFSLKLELKDFFLIPSPFSLYSKRTAHAFHFYIRQDPRLSLLHFLQCVFSRTPSNITCTNKHGDRNRRRERGAPAQKSHTSVIWNWFRFAASDEHQTTPRCNLCLKAVIISGSSTTNLFQHLKHKHPSEGSYTSEYSQYKQSINR